MKANILVVDDTPENLRLLMGILGEQGYKIRPAADGAHALTTAQLEPPDLILLDVIMPEMNGYEVCEQLKADERTRAIPVIFISALNGTFDKVKAFAAGAVDYISKPIQAEEVLARVNTHLSMYNLQKSLQQEIARRKQSEEELRVLNRQLQEANASKDKFFSILAHDLRGPLGALCELPKILIEDIEHYQQSELIRMFRTQQRTADRIYALLNNLLTWSRLQRDLIEYKPQRLDMATIVARNFDLFTSNAVQKQITLRSQIKKNLFVYADEYMVDTVVRNLISNALKFTNAAGAIAVAATQNKAHLELSVSDTGTGILDKDIPLLFRIDTKYQQPGTANEPGTGLGLILCKEFVEKHDGKIWVESEVGKGTTVRFTLPTPPVNTVNKNNSLCCAESTQKSK